MIDSQVLSLVSFPMPILQDVARRKCRSNYVAFAKASGFGHHTQRLLLLNVNVGNAKVNQDSRLTAESPMGSSTVRRCDYRGSRELFCRHHDCDLHVNVYLLP